MPKFNLAGGKSLVLAQQGSVGRAAQELVRIRWVAA